MSYVLKFFDILKSMGPAVMMTFIIFIIALCVGSKLSEALRAGMTVGVGFTGLTLVIGFLGDTIGPVAQQMVKNLGLSLDVIDVGWVSASAITFATEIGALIFPVCIAVNVVMLLCNATQTADIDIWNYWQLAFTGALVYFATDSIFWGLFAAACNMIIVLVLADMTAHMVEKEYGLKGVSIPHSFTTGYVPFGYVINKVLDKIPVINKIDIDAEKMKDKMGVLGEPLFIGSLVGLIMGIAAYGIKAYDQYLSIAISLGASLVLIPKMASFLGEGLGPVSEKAQTMISRKFKNRKIFIGLDSSTLMGNPVALSVGVILIPVMIILAFVLPGNHVIPFADIACIPFMLIFIVPMCRGNAFRTLIIGLIFVVGGLYLGTSLAALETQAAVATNFAIPGGFTKIASINNTFHPLTWILVKLFEVLKTPVGAAIMGIGTVAIAVYNRFRIVKITAKEQLAKQQESEQQPE